MPPPSLCLHLPSLQVGLDRFYHPVVQFAEDSANYSINSGLPLITGGGLQEEVLTSLLSSHPSLPAGGAPLLGPL